VFKAYETKRCPARARFSPDPPLCPGEQRVVTHECPAVQGECGLPRSQNPRTEGHPLDASLPWLQGRLRRSELGVVAGLAPVLRLADRAGLGRLVTEHGRIDKPGGVNADPKISSFEPDPWSRHEPHRSRRDDPAHPASARRLRLRAGRLAKPGPGQDRARQRRRAGGPAPAAQRGRRVPRRARQHAHRWRQRRTPPDHRERRRG
jgi:hypothetical protein